MCGGEGVALGKHTENTRGNTPERDSQHNGEERSPCPKSWSEKRDCGGKEETQGRKKTGDTTTCGQKKQMSLSERNSEAKQGIGKAEG